MPSPYYFNLKEMENFPNRNLENFPYEVLFNILLYAKPKDIASYCQTSKSASEICRDKDFWRMKLWKDYGEQKQVEGMTWQEQFQFKQIGIINLPIAAGISHYGIIDDQGKVYASGILLSNTEAMKDFFEIPFYSKAISITAGKYHLGDKKRTINMVMENGKAYRWGAHLGIRTLPIKKTNKFKHLSGKIVKMDRNNYANIDGFIMDEGSIYLSIGKFNDHIIVLPEKGRKIIDLIIPDMDKISSLVICYYLDNHGDVYFFYVSKDDEKVKIKMIFPEPIKQLSGSMDINVALSINGNVYAWGYGHNDGRSTDGTGYYHLASGSYRIKKDDTGWLPKLNPVFILENIDEKWNYNIPHEVYKVNIPAFVVFISAGYGVIAAVTSKGTVYVWGPNDSVIPGGFIYRLVGKTETEKLLSSGRMINISRYKTPVIVRPLELKLTSKIKFISMGDAFTIALTEDGIMNYWGTPMIEPENTI